MCNGTGHVNVEAEEPVKTNGDRIRSMGDAMLAHFIYSLCPASVFFCEMCEEREKCLQLVARDGDIPASWCKSTIREWLRTPFDEKPRSFPFEDKQESGLIEED